MKLPGLNIQGDSQRKISVLGGDIIGYREKKKFLQTYVQFCMVAETELFECTNNDHCEGQ